MKDIRQRRVLITIPASLRLQCRTMPRPGREDAELFAMAAGRHDGSATGVGPDQQFWAWSLLDLRPRNRESVTEAGASRNARGRRARSMCRIPPIGVRCAVSSHSQRLPGVCDASRHSPAGLKCHRTTLDTDTTSGEGCRARGGMENATNFDGYGDRKALSADVRSRRTTHLLLNRCLKCVDGGRWQNSA
jgi:hypothetical protein